MSVEPSYFDEMYAHADDPWDLAGRWYDARKYAITVASLPRPRYRNAFEPACSVGVLTELLAARCDALLSSDRSSRAVEVARERLARHRHVTFAQAALPDEWPEGRFDLIVLSELGYYLAEPVWRQVVAKAVASLEPDGSLVAVHWRHPIPGCPIGGDQAQSVVREHPLLLAQAHHEEEDFRLDVLALAPAVSVATAEGLVNGVRASGEIDD